MPALRSPAPRPQTAPSTTAAAKGSSRSVPCQCCAPAVHVHGVGVPDEEQPRPAAGAAPLAPDVRPAGQEVGGPHVLDPAPPHLAGEEGGEARLVAGDALAADGAPEQRQRVVAVERRRQPVVERAAHASAPASRGGGSDRRASGASAPKSALCRCPSPIAAAPISAACGPSRLGCDRHRRRHASGQERPHPRDQLRPAADRAAEDDQPRVGDRRDSGDPAREKSCRLVEHSLGGQIARCGAGEDLGDLDLGARRRARHSARGCRPKRPAARRRRSGATPPRRGRRRTAGSRVRLPRCPRPEPARRRRPARRRCRCRAR